MSGHRFRSRKFLRNPVCDLCGAVRLKHGRVRKCHGEGWAGFTRRAPIRWD